MRLMLAEVREDWKALHSESTSENEFNFYTDIFIGKVRECVNFLRAGKCQG